MIRKDSALVASAFFVALMKFALDLGGAFRCRLGGDRFGPGEQRAGDQSAGSGENGGTGCVGPPWETRYPRLAPWGGILNSDNAHVIIGRPPVPFAHHIYNEAMRNLKRLDLILDTFGFVF